MPRRRYTEEQFRAAVADPSVESLADLCRAVGILPRGANYETLRAYATRLDVDLTRLETDRTRRGRRTLRPGERSYSARDFRAAIADSAVVDLRTLAERLGLAPYRRTYDRLIAFADELGVDIARLRIDGRRRARSHDEHARPPRSVDSNQPSAPRRDGVCADDELRALLPQVRSRAALLRRVGLQPTGANYRRLQIQAARLGLDLDQLPGQGWSRGSSLASSRRRPLDDLLVQGSRAQSSALRVRLIEEGVKQHRCEACHRSTWLDGPIPLELDHRNGDRTDNRLGNLRILCPNCHALTPTYRGRNRGRGQG